MAFTSPSSGSEAARGRVLVGTSGPEVFLLVEGKGTHLNSQALREFLGVMLDRGHLLFRLDLGKCQYLDSTFIGVLASTCLRLRASAGRFVLSGISARNLDLLKTLGIDRFFEVEPSADSATAVPESLAPLTCMSAEDRCTWGETMLEAHRTLAECDPRNGPRFKDVIDYLEEDLHGGGARRER